MLAAAAITLLVPVLGVAGPATAQPAAPAALATFPISANTTNWLCDTADPGQDCWGPDQSGDIGTGTAVLDGFDTGHTVNEASVETDTVACNGGTVTMTCPFVVGSGLNKALVGHTIVVLCFGGGVCNPLCADSSGNNIVLNDCNGSHAAYVIVDNGFALISVGASNADGSGVNTAELAFTHGAGGGGVRHPVQTTDQATLDSSSSCVGCIDHWEESQPD
jgi:hypothetical protein